jgi:hypothetical protein
LAIHQVPQGIHFQAKSKVQLVKSASHLILIKVIHQVGVIVQVLATLQAVQLEKFLVIIVLLLPVIVRSASVCIQSVQSHQNVHLVLNVYQLIIAQVAVNTQDCVIVTVGLQVGQAEKAVAQLDNVVVFHQLVADKLVLPRVNPHIVQVVAVILPVILKAVQFQVSLLPVESQRENFGIHQSFHK